MTGSALCLTFGMENCVDFLGSAIVLWRFFAPFSKNVDVEMEHKLQRREKRASMAISFILILLGMAITVTAMDDFARGQDQVSADSSLDDIIAISFVSFLVFGVLTVFKFHYAIALESASLQKDGICSLIGTILAGTLFINTLIVLQYPSTWWIDPLVAFICGLAAIALGCQHLHVAKNRDSIPIFTATWWFTSQGDGKDETSGRPVGPEDLMMELSTSSSTTTTTTTAADAAADAAVSSGERRDNEIV
jgi:divalent metal cation (Fe/Co/Zn/Cd) transporter